MGMRRQGMRRLKTWILKFALLKLLSETPRHGYDLIREIRENGWAGGRRFGLSAARRLRGRRFHRRPRRGRVSSHLRTHPRKDEKIMEERWADIGRFFEDDGKERGHAGPAGANAAIRRVD